MTGSMIRQILAFVFASLSGYSLFAAGSMTIQQGSGGGTITFQQGSGGGSITINQGGGSGPTPPTPPSGVELWEAGVGMFQDSGMTTPVTAGGQILAKWVGNLGTVLTCINTTAVSNSGSLVARPNGSTGYCELPPAYSMNRRDISVSMHAKRPGLWAPRGYFGFSLIARDFELINYTNPQSIEYDGITVNYCDVAGKASWHTMTVRSNASALKVGMNGTEVTKTAVAAGTFTGGRFEDIGGAPGATPGFDMVYGITLGTYADDAKIAEILAYWNSKEPIPSETTPTENLVVFGDSNTEGTNTVSQTSWLTQLLDSRPNIRTVPVVGAAQYFQVGGSPMNTPAVATMMGFEYRASAGRNIMILVVTNDFNAGASGTTYYNNAKTFGQARQGEGWEVALVKFPNRNTPYTTTDPTYNTEVAAFNALLISDPWADYVVDLAVVMNGIGANMGADGVHWTDAGMTAISNAFISGLGL